MTYVLYELRYTYLYIWRKLYQLQFIVYVGDGLYQDRPRPPHVAQITAHPVNVLNCFLIFNDTSRRVNTSFLQWWNVLLWRVSMDLKTTGPVAAKQSKRPYYLRHLVKASQMVAQLNRFSTTIRFLLKATPSQRTRLKS